MTWHRCQALPDAQLSSMITRKLVYYYYFNIDNKRANHHLQR